MAPRATVVPWSTTCWKIKRQDGWRVAAARMLRKEKGSV
jgi:hypothetical protein